MKRTKRGHDTAPGHAKRRIGALMVAGLLALGVTLPLACGEELGLASEAAIVEHPSTLGGDNVINGSAYDLGWIELDGIERLVVPPATRIQRSDELEAGRAKLRLTKTLGYAGDPPALMSPRHARRFMGVAVQREGEASGTLKLGTYGEWDSEEAGRAWVALELVLPEAAEIELGFDDALGGKESAAAGDLELGRSGGHWYASNQPASGWMPLTTKPDEAAARAERP